MIDPPARPLLAYYGDDFTGSTDVMEAIARAGLRAALFLDAPTPERLTGRFAGLHAVGLAGTSRALPPDPMEAVLAPAFEALAALRPRLVHYKICSTFDSSPEVGSIGRAIDVGHRIFDPPYIPLVVGAPILKRYCVFGQLFATVGAETHRLDRHPTMRCHPVTPMRESDLRLVLRDQTAKRVALMDVLHLAGTDEQVSNRFRAILDDRPEVLLFDTLDEANLARVGGLIWSGVADCAGPGFAVGSSGLEYALVAHWRACGQLADTPAIAPAGPVDRLAVVSGSCSPTTREQILWALDRGFAGIDLDAAALADPDRAAVERARATGRALEVLRNGRSVIVHSALGTDDPRIASVLGPRGRSHPDAGDRLVRLGEGLGLILRDLIEGAGLRRVVVAGGDTSGHAARQLGIDALEFVMPMTPGSPLCRASSRRPGIDGLEIVLKGGQVGGANFFGNVLQGQN